MPGLSCRDTVQRLRELRPTARILLASGYTAGETVTQLMAQTGLGMLRKPYDPDQMLNAIGVALAQ
jgi:DNA-binding NarL/FixJ family response regulator